MPPKWSAWKMFIEVKRNQGNQKQTGGNRFRLKQENEEVNERIIRDIKNLFELEDYYKPVTVGHINSNISNLKVIVIEIKYYQSNNSLKKLNHT